MSYLKVFVILCFLLLSQVQSVFAQGEPTTLPTPTPVLYDLPYPGILPGHPFYFVKAFRDNMMSFFISNPLKKAEFNLLQADKYLQASYLVFSKDPRKGKEALLLLTQAENYFSEAITKAGEARKQGMDSRDRRKKLTISNLKHQEVIAGMAKQAKGDEKKQFDALYIKAKQLEERVKHL